MSKKNLENPQIHLEICLVGYKIKINMKYLKSYNEGLFKDSENDKKPALSGGRRVLRSANSAP